MEVIGEYLAVVHLIPTAVVSTLKPVILTLFAKDTGPFSPPLRKYMDHPMLHFHLNENLAMS